MIRARKKKKFKNGKIASEELFQMKISGIMAYKFCIFYVENFKLLQDNTKIIFQAFLTFIAISQIHFITFQKL